MARIDECIEVECHQQAMQHSAYCTQHGSLVTRGSAIKPRPEWWSPSEYCLMSIFIRLSQVAQIWIHNDEAFKVYVIGDHDCSQFTYDTPEHRDEDYTRLKLALGVE